MRTAWVLVCGVVLLVGAAGEAAPIVTQGRLLSAGTVAPDGTYSAASRIFDAPVEGDQLWVEEQELAVDGGVFSAALGEDGGLADSLLGIEQAWVEVQIGEEAPLPRRRLAAAPLSLLSQGLDCTGCVGLDQLQPACAKGQVVRQDGDGWSCGDVDFAGARDVRDFGAIASDGLDDRAAIQAAIDSIPLDEQARVILPPGTLQISGPILFGQRGVHLIGAGIGAWNGDAAYGTAIKNMADDDAIVVQSMAHNILQGFKVTDGLGGGRTQGAGVRAERFDNKGNVMLVARDMSVWGHYDGFEIVRGLFCEFRSVRAANNIQHGFVLGGDFQTTGTSINFVGTFASDNGMDGYSIGGYGYSALIATASDGNGRHGYRIHQTAANLNARGHGLFSVGAEGNQESSISIEDSTAISIIGGSLVNSGGNAVTLKDSGGVVIAGLHMSGSGGYGISASGGGAVLLTSTFTANAAGKIEDPGGVVARIDPTSWRFGTTGLMGAAPGSSYIQFTKGSLIFNTASGVAGQFAGKKLVLEKRGITKIGGLSATTTEARNLSGDETVEGDATTVTIKFNTPELDKKYYLTVTPTTLTGTPTPGSTRVRSVVKDLNTATITLESAPGAGASVTFDWHLIR